MISPSSLFIIIFKFSNIFQTVSTTLTSTITLSLAPWWAGSRSSSNRVFTKSRYQSKHMRLHWGIYGMRRISLSRRLWVLKKIGDKEKTIFFIFWNSNLEINSLKFRNIFFQTSKVQKSRKLIFFNPKNIFFLK